MNVDIFCFIVVFYVAILASLHMKKETLVVIELKYGFQKFRLDF